MLRRRGRTALALLLLLLAAGPSGLAAAGEDWVTVLFVNDGDTITVSLNGQREKIRLLGVDAPETNHSRKLGRAAAQAGRTEGQEARLGAMARDFVVELLPRGSKVRLRGDRQAGARDRYGRLLAYVYLEDGRMLNDLLLQQGQARVYQRCRCAHLERFRGLEAQARRQRLGLWSLGGP